MSFSIRWNDKGKCWYIVTAKRIDPGYVHYSLTDLDELSPKANAILLEIAEILSE